MLQIVERNCEIMDSKYRLFKTGLHISLIVLLLLYISISHDEINAISKTPFLAFSIVISVLYLIFYRRNSIFCYESFFLLLYILSAFFYNLVIENLLDTSTVSAAFFNTSFSPEIENKGVLVNTISLVVFLLACIRVNERPSNILLKQRFTINRDYSLSIKLLSIATGVFIIYLFATGVILSWFQYSNNVSDYSNSDIVYLTMLFLVLTSLEFSRLSTNLCDSFKSFIRGINKVYLTEILTISFLLLVSGNRNECLLILLPLVICYHIFIKPFNNKQFLIMLSVGIVLMVVIGLTRQSGTLDSLRGESISLYEITRDFGFVDNNTKYLIYYTDKNAPVGFGNALLNLFSSIPFLGGIIVSLTGWKYNIRTTDLTTQGMQVSSNMDSGLGTSLLGDLYYTGGFIFTIIFMYFFGWLMASLYRRFSIEKKYDIWSLIIYLFMFSNVVYCIRAEWTMPLRYIGFSFVILAVLRLFQPLKKQC